MHSIIQQIEQNLVLVEKSSFIMGSENGNSDERPVHEVSLARDFYIGKYPVTQAFWQIIMGANPSHFKSENHPVERVSWDDTQVFLKKLNTLAKGKYQYRLPTESEWEYAARGGKYRSNFKYSGCYNLKEVAWYNRNSRYGTKPIGLKLSNILGLHDMSGNVWEWCEDQWHNNYENAPIDGRAWLEDGTNSHVLRGGSWNQYYDFCRVAARDGNGDVERDYCIGFRLSRF